MRCQVVVELCEKLFAPGEEGIWAIGDVEDCVFIGWLHCWLGLSRMWWLWLKLGLWTNSVFLYFFGQFDDGEEKYQWGGDDSGYTSDNAYYCRELSQILRFE